MISLSYQKSNSGYDTRDIIMDYLQRTNKILLTLVIILLAFVILSFAKVVFTGMSDLEWGSVSDWFSTASSIATTYIAFLAYKAAPNWFKQKTYEAGFDHVSSILSEYDAIVDEIQKNYFIILNIQSIDSTNSTIWLGIETLAYRIISLQSKIYACKRWDVDVLPETYRCIARLRTFCELCYQVKGSLVMDNLDDVIKAKEDILSVKSYIADDSANFKKNIHDYFQMPQ